MSQTQQAPFVRTSQPNWARGKAGGFSTTSVPFMIPAVGASVQVAVDDASWMQVSQHAFVGAGNGDGTMTGGFFVITAVSGLLVTIERKPSSGSSAAGVVVSAGSPFRIGGQPAEDDVLPLSAPISRYPDAATIRDALSGPEDYGLIPDRSEVQIARGTTAQHASFVGKLGELTVDTDRGTVRVQDGATPGGNPLQRELMFDVRGYGAKGDGSTNDYAAIAAAIVAAISSGGGIVRLPPGNFIIATGLVVADPRVVLQGSGAGVTTITYTGSGTALTIGDTGSSYYGKFDGFKLAGTSSATRGILFSGIASGKLSHVIITGFTKAAAKGLHLYADSSNLVLSLTIDDCIVEHNFRNVDISGAINGATNNIRITNSKIRNATGDYNIYGASASFNWRIDGNDLEANAVGYPSVYIDGVQGVTISHNYFENTSAAPAIQIYTSSLQGVEILNNWMGAQVPYAYAINAAGVVNKGWKIEGNVIGGWTYAIALGGTYYGLSFKSNYLNSVAVSDFGGTYHGCVFEDASGNITRYAPSTVFNGGPVTINNGALEVTEGLTKATGGFATSIVSVASASYAVPATATRIVNYYSGGTSTFTLGLATAGREITITSITAHAVESASANVASIADGSLSTSILPAIAGKWATLVGDGANWSIVAGN